MLGKRRSGAPKLDSGLGLARAGQNLEGEQE